MGHRKNDVVGASTPPLQLLNYKKAHAANSPGRYYAVAVMKVILGQIILNYDCDLVDLHVSRWFTWRSSMLPKGSTMVRLTPRDVGVQMAR